MKLPSVSASGARLLSTSMSADIDHSLRSLLSAAPRSAIFLFPETAEFHFFPGSIIDIDRGARTEGTNSRERANANASGMGEKETILGVGSGEGINRERSRCRSQENNLRHFAQFLLLTQNDTMFKG